MKKENKSLKQSKNIKILIILSLLFMVSIIVYLICRDNESIPIGNIILLAIAVIFGIWFSVWLGIETKENEIEKKKKILGEYLKNKEENEDEKEN